MEETAFWTLFQDTGDPVAYLLFRIAGDSS